MSSEHYKVDVTLRHPSASVSQVHLSAGHETPVHAHRHDYVVHPRSETRLLRTSFKDGQVIKTEEVERKRASWDSYDDRSAALDFAVRAAGRIIAEYLEPGGPWHDGACHEPPMIYDDRRLGRAAQT